MAARSGGADQDDGVAVVLAHADTAARRIEGIGDATDFWPSGARILKGDIPLGRDMSSP